MPKTIVADHLTKIFGSHPRDALRLVADGVPSAEIRRRLGTSVAVRQVSFQVREGEIFVVMGLSGSGKSTLVRLLNGLLPATSGAVRIAGHPVTDLGKRELVAFRRSTTAMVFQSFALFPHRTALENVAFGLEVAGVARDRRRQRARAALEQVGLGADAGRLPGELSGGMRQRVGLARALAMDPPILLMDEAFSALDPLIRREMQEQLLRLQREHRRTIVFISHDLDEAIRLGDRIALMEEGTLLQVGTPQELLLRPEGERVRRFFRDVDVSTVLTVEDLVEQPPLVLDPQAALERPPRAVRGGEGPAAAVAYLVDRNHRYRGLIPREALPTEAGARPPAPPAEDGGPTLPATATVQEAIAVVAGAAHPVPVLGERERFLGVVSPRRLLRTLAP